MAFLDFSHQLFGGQNVRVYCVTAGAADLPSSGTFFNVGDIVININGVIGTPAQWVVSSTSPLTFTASSYTGAKAGVIRTVAGNATITTADDFLFISAAATVTLPAATAFPAGLRFTVKSTSAAVTITPVSGTIDGNASATLAGQGKTSIVSNGTNYFSVY